ncbi:MAG: PAS domain-containing protein [Parvibaculum sp.]|uniref:PAS domain-containing protein n=1 Tax=Parvibaculum sp. TaxID=2024848 RepID=UPI0025D8D405|nr:PAS domain-containing protein [Parvibaculum sp.]MCE9648630.1 PAS domain-containing protein [Parvibaculum sp.]
MFDLQKPTGDTRDAGPLRSPQSLAFEAMWRDLPREGLIPSRSAFRPERAARLLPNILLLEIDTSPPVTTRIRLVGGALRSLAGCDVTGLDYLDLVPDRDYQAAHLRTCALYPCATWAASPVVYKRGYNSLIEITNFPLTDDVTGMHLGLVLMREIGGDLPQYGQTGGPLELRPATAKAFIDIGAGVPQTTV